MMIQVHHILQQAAIRYLHHILQQPALRNLRHILRQSAIRSALYHTCSRGEDSSGALATCWWHVLPIGYSGAARHTVIVLSSSGTGDRKGHHLWASKATAPRAVLGETQRREELGIIHRDMSCDRKLTQSAEVFMVLLVEASGLALPSAPHALHRVIAAFRQGHESYLVTR